MFFTKIFSIVSYLDLFSSPILLKFEKKERTSTYFGLIFSFGIIIFLSNYFAQCDVFQRSAPSVINLDVSNVIRPQINYEDRLFAVSLTDDEGVPFNDSGYFYFEVINRQYRVNSDGIFESVKNISKSFHACQPNDFNRGEFYTLGLDKAFCLDENAFELGGYWDEVSVTFLEINLKECDNVTMNNTCKPLEQVQSYFTDKLFNIYFEGSNCDPSSYKSPINPISYNDYYKLNYDLRKSVTAFLKNIQMTTDDGIIISNTWDLGGILFDSKDIDIWNYDENSTDSKNLIFQYNIYSSRNTQKLTRTYQKLIEALSDLGGIANIVMIFGYFLTNIENSFTVGKKVMNSLYSFQSIEKLMERSESRKTSKVEVELIEPGATNKSISFIKKRLTVLNEKEELNSPLRSDLNKNTLEHIGQSESFQTCIHPATSDPVKFKKDDQYQNNDEINLRISRKRSMKNAFDEVVSDGEKKIGISEEKTQIHPKSLTTVFPVDDSPLGKSTPRTLDGKRMTKRNTHFDKKLKNFAQYEEYLRDSGSKLTMNFLEYSWLILKQLFKKGLTLKEKLFLKGVHIYDDELDIVQILRRIQEIEKLKLVFFNEDQRLLFNLIDKPMIYLDEFGRGKEEIDSEVKVMRSSSMIDEHKMRRVFEKINARPKSELSPIDKRLVDLVEKNLNEFLNNII